MTEQITALIQATEGHTEGPWIYRTRGARGQDRRCIDSPTEREGKFVPAFSIKLPSTVSEADARLFATAPEFRAEVIRLRTENARLQEFIKTGDMEIDRLRFVITGAHDWAFIEAVKTTNRLLGRNDDPGLMFTHETFRLWEQVKDISDYELQPIYKEAILAKAQTFMTADSAAIARLEIKVRDLTRQLEEAVDRIDHMEGRLGDD